MTQIPDVEFDDDAEEFYPAGCSACDTSGWNHGCCDDMCRHCEEPENCSSARPCSRCNPEGGIL